MCIRDRDKLGFRREGMDVYTTVQIPFTTAVFGGEARDVYKRQYVKYRVH